MKVIDIAKICHEANKSLCEGLGDFSLKAWDEAEDWQLESAVKWVKHFIAHPNDPDSAQHDAWASDKRADGWVYGAVKDADKKTHPCLVTFHALPPGQKAKDTLFHAVCKSVIGLLDE